MANEAQAPAQATAQPTAQPSALALLKRDTVDVVAERVRAFCESGQLHLPANYSAENAMKSAWLILQATKDKEGRSALAVCSKDSIANSLLDMVVQGLNPAKRQGYFIVYGQQLVFQRSYFGTMAVAKHVAGATAISAQIVYGGDEFEYALEGGGKRVTKHTQNIANVRDGNIVGAYCTLELPGGRQYTEVMTWEQIQRAWSKSRQSPDAAGSTHKLFADQMALRTVINRACKTVINPSMDDALLRRHFDRADEELAEAEVEELVAAEANAELIDIEPESGGDVPQLPYTGETRTSAMPALAAEVTVSASPAPKRRQTSSAPEQQARVPGF